MRTQTEDLEDLFENQILTAVEPEKEVIPDDYLPHYAMSFNLEIPLYNFSNSKKFGKYPIKLGGITYELQKIDPFVLIPIITMSFDGPPENLVAQIPDPNTKEPFNPNLVGSGMTRHFHYSARQNLKKLTDLYGGFGVVAYESLVGLEDTTAQKISNIVLPMHDRDVFPITERTYRATTRRGFFLDQVSNYLNSKAKSRIDNLSTDDEQYNVAMRLFREMIAGAEQAANMARASVDGIIRDIEKGNRSPFSFSKLNKNEVFPADFMMLANLNMTEPKVKSAMQMDNQQPQAAAPADTTRIDQAMQMMAETNQRMATLLGQMAASGANLQVAQTPAQQTVIAPNTEVKTGKTAGQTEEIPELFAGGDKTENLEQGKEESKADFTARMAAGRAKRAAEKKEAEEKGTQTTPPDA